MLNIQKAVDGTAAVLTLEGRLDTVSSPELERVLAGLMPRLRELTLDMERLDYLSSAGLRVLLSAHKAMEGKGGLTVRHVNDTISEIFTVTGFCSILKIV